MDKAIDEKVKGCNSCQRMQHLSMECPWSRLHVDYMLDHLCMGRMFLIVTDSHLSGLKLSLLVGQRQIPQLNT